MDINTYRSILEKHNISNSWVKEINDKIMLRYLEEGNVILFEGGLYEVTYVANNSGSSLNLASHVELLDLQTNGYRTVMCR